MPNRGWLSALLALLLGAACIHLRPATSPVGNTGDRILISEEMIARSGGQTAWEVLKKEAPQLTYGERRDGQPTKLGRRGRSSLLLNEAPLVFVDGVQLVDFRRLQDLPASTLQSIEILNGLDGTTYYGSNAVSGVILIRTRNGTPS